MKEGNPGKPVELSGFFLMFQTDLRLTEFFAILFCFYSGCKTRKQLDQSPDCHMQVEPYRERDREEEREGETTVEKLSNSTAIF